MIAVDEDEIDRTSLQSINSAVSGFLDRPSVVTNIDRPTAGRSRSGNQYRITTVDQRRVSVKRAHSKPSDLCRELFHADMRQLLGLPHYKLEHKTGFPLPGWESADCIMIDWGVADRRLGLDDCRVRRYLKDNWQSLRQLGQVAAQNIVFATGDRKAEHLVWDLDEKAMFSIDHELLAISSETIEYFRSELELICGKDWRDLPHRLDYFESGFATVWNRAELEADKIRRSYVNRGLDGDVAGFSARLVKGSSHFMGRLAP